MMFQRVLVLYKNDVAGFEPVIPRRDASHEMMAMSGGKSDGDRVLYKNDVAGFEPVIPRRDASHEPMKMSERTSDGDVGKEAGNRWARSCSASASGVLILKARIGSGSLSMVVFEEPAEALAADDFAFGSWRSDVGVEAQRSVASCTKMMSQVSSR